MVSRIESPWNYAVCYLETLFGTTPLSKASGFFWLHDGRTFLVTNWHVLCGRDPNTRQALHSSKALPDRVRFTVYKADGEGQGEYRSLLYGTIELPLAGQSGEPTWFEHPAGGGGADIALLDVTPEILGNAAEVKAANIAEPDVAPLFQPSQDVFIVGYPLGRIADAPIPIWKRGTIATEPTFDPDGRPIVYVDSATRSGMSGSIVLARHEFLGGYSKRDGSKVVSLFARADLILGIYSGRIGPHQVEAQLGIVWKRHVIEETIAARKRGSCQF